jgi:hypothetical protein
LQSENATGKAQTIPVRDEHHRRELCTRMDREDERMNYRAEAADRED